MTKVACVFGLSGVGKGWLISRFTDMRIAHVQASQLLRKARQEIVGRMESDEELRQGAVLDNQALLVHAFARFRATSTLPIVFDGHSVIDAGAELLEIPVDVIRDIAPAGNLFIVDDPTAIIARRAADRTRERPTRSDCEIDDHQRRARELCEQYAKDLDVSLTVIRAGDREGFSVALTAVLSA